MINWVEREQLLFKSTDFGDDKDRALQKSDNLGLTLLVMLHITIINLTEAMMCLSTYLELTTQDI